MSEWTEAKEMKLKKEKSKYMIFNFSKHYQFNTRLKLEDRVLDQVQETKLLGLVLRDDLSWKSNTRFITKKAYKRMIILKNLFTFNVSIEDLVEIYLLYIRSVVEQSAVVRHSSLSKGEHLGLERIQKIALILKEEYTTYSEALKARHFESQEK